MSKHTVTRHAHGRCTVQCGQCPNTARVDIQRLYAASIVRCTRCGLVTPTEDLTAASSANRRV